MKKLLIILAFLQVNIYAITSTRHLFKKGNSWVRLAKVYPVFAANIALIRNKYPTQEVFNAMIQDIIDLDLIKELSQCNTPEELYRNIEYLLREGTLEIHGNKLLKKNGYLTQEVLISSNNDTRPLYVLVRLRALYSEKEFQLALQFLQQHNMTGMELWYIYEISCNKNSHTLFKLIEQLRSTY